LTSVLKFSDATTLALHAMVYLANRGEQAATTKEIAEAYGFSEAHLSKVMQRLSRAGLVKSSRGPKGGFALAKASRDITLLNVYESIEGTLTPANCLLDRPVCGGNCILGLLLGSVNRQVAELLAERKLSALTSLREQMA
jgi:Rrf2 family protein